MGCCWAACSFVPEPFSDQPDATPIDAYSAPVEFQLRVTEYLDYENPEIGMTVDGVHVVPEEYSLALSRTFSSYQEAQDTPIDVETWYGERRIFHWVVWPGVCEACIRPAGQTPTVELMGLCLEPSGELRFGSSSCSFPWGNGCHADAFCDPPCYPFPDSWLHCYPADQGCGLVVSVAEPFYGHFDCVPAGQVSIGQSCVRGAPGLDTGYDDCAVGGVCIDDVCREVCAENRPCSDGSSCELFPHMRFALGACMIDLPDLEPERERPLRVLVIDDEPAVGRAIQLPGHR